MLSPQERLSPQELKRRWDLVRANMKEKGLEVLVISGFRFVAATGYLRYMTNWAEPFGGEVLVFPLNGTPTFLARTGERALLVQQYLGLQSSVGSTGAHAAEMLKSIGHKRVGICGLQTMVAEFYVRLTTALPDVDFVEASDILDKARWIKSEEELHHVRETANLTDVAFQVFSTLARPGRTEAEVFIEVEHIVKLLGAETTYFMMSADPKPVTKFLDLAFDTYEKGDLLLFNAEIAGPGGYYCQLQRTLSLGPPTREAQSAYDVCVDALNSGAALLRPGQKANAVYRAILNTIEKAGYKMGLHPGHSQGLDIFERPLINDKEEVDLSANMVMVLHPHILLPGGGGVWIGETFLVTPEGPRRLQASGRDLKVVDDVNK